MVTMGKSAVKSHLKEKKHLENARRFRNNPSTQQRSVDSEMEQISTIQGENCALRKELWKIAWKFWKNGLLLKLFCNIHMIKWFLNSFHRLPPLFRLYPVVTKMCAFVALYNTTGPNQKWILYILTVTSKVLRLTRIRKTTGGKCKLGYRMLGCHHKKTLTYAEKKEINK